MAQDRVAHIREIEAAGCGAASPRDAMVLNSWRRCLTQHRLDPAKGSEAFIVTETRLREHRQGSEDLLHIARAGIESLYRMVAGQNYVLLLADRAGVAVEYLGDHSQKSALRESGLSLGAEWSEARAGTCAVGSCIEVQEPMVIHQTDHFGSAHTDLSCTAAPIFDTAGALTAVLDISLLSSPRVKSSQTMALNLVKTAARRIEMANLMARCRNDWVLRFSASPEFLDVDPEAAIALDAGGAVIGMTHGGARMLARAAGGNWRDPAGLLGRNLTEFLQLDLDRLHDLTRHRPSEQRFVALRDGTMLFGHAIEPERARLRRAPDAPKVAQPLRALAGDDPQMVALIGRASRLCATRLPLMITGGSGSGKGVLARAIHDAAGRGPFVTLDCTAHAPEVLEGVLFGHAARGAEGSLIEQAQGGTLFLDEVAEAPLPLQARLLRLIAEDHYTPVGGTKARAADLRILSATQAPLSARIAAGAFREDLFHRLNAASLHLPDLRHRFDFEWLLDRMLNRHGPGLRLATEARIALRAHPWPGNLRELDHAIRAAVALCDGGVITCDDLPAAVTAPRASAPDPAGAEDLRRILAETGGNISEAARRLGVNRSTIHRRILRLSLH